MSDLTDYLEQQLRAWMSQGTNMPTAPGTLYIALHTSDPGETPDGSTEVGAADYSRVSVTAGSGFSTSTSGDASRFSNANEISFGTATNNWGTVSHVSIWDGSATTDNCLAAFALSSSKSISTDDEATFAAGDLSFDIN